MKTRMILVIIGAVLLSATTFAHDTETVTGLHEHGGVQNGKKAAVKKQEAIMTPEMRQKASKAGLKTEKEGVSYCIGAKMGSQLKDQKLDIDISAFVKGFTAMLKDQETVFTSQECIRILAEHRRMLQEERRLELIKERERNMKKGAKFLAENKKKKGVKTLASGLQYKIIKKGTGAKPKMTDEVKLHFRGTLIDGTEFESTYKRGGPATYILTEVIPGWHEGIQMMKEGATWEFYIPAELAYDEHRGGSLVKAGSTVIYKIEFIEIVK